MIKNKTVYIILSLFLLGAILVSCSGEDKFEVDKCENIDCLDKGECYIDNGNARCKCEEGYYVVSNECVKYECRDGYTLDGTNCVKTCQDCQGKDEYYSNPCEPVACSGHGYCVSDDDRAVYCRCYPGYENEAGVNCVEGGCDGVSCASQ